MALSAKLIQREQDKFQATPSGNTAVTVLDGACVMNSKITTAGSITYNATALPGTSQSTAAWQVEKIDQTDPNNMLITWAGTGQFDQVATDLTALTYS